MAKVLNGRPPRGRARRLIGEILNRETSSQAEAMGLIFDQSSNTGAARLVARALRSGRLQDRLALVRLIQKRANDETFARRFRGAVRHAYLVDIGIVAAERAVVHAAGPEAVLDALRDERSPGLRVWTAFFAHYCGPLLFPSSTCFNDSVAPLARRILVDEGQIGTRRPRQPKG